MSKMAPGWKVVEQFEKAMAEYTGAPHAVAVDTCTAALFLCFKRKNVSVVELPSQTYLGVACAAIHAGCRIRLSDYNWFGSYDILTGAGAITDSACSLNQFRLSGKNLTCLSFQSRKHLKIGRGGMILTASAEDAEWFRAARFLGRSEPGGVPGFVGWHCFMEPERAARGLQLLESLPDRNPDLNFDYPDLRDYPCLREHMV